MSRPWLPARCWLCRRDSEPRELGRTPNGWGRERHGQGKYFCPACITPKTLARWDVEVTLTPEQWRQVRQIQAGE